MIIKNGNVFGINCSFACADIKIENGLITEVTKAGDARDGAFEEVFDATGMYVIPGLIDVHLHGCMGKDFCTASVNSIAEMVKYERESGVTTIVPTSMTLPYELLSECYRRIAEYNHCGDNAIGGINMEGPFISMSKKGAQNPLYIMNPDIKMFEKLEEDAEGLIKLVDIAPELDGSMEFIDALKEKVHVSVAHSEADYNTALEAFMRGADHVTHMYNAMTAFSHRNPGIIGAASDSPNAYCELIADGVHSAPAAVRMALKLIGDDRLVFISDSLEACGMPDGEYSLGGQAIVKTGKKAVIKGTDTIAGSVMNLMDILKIAVLVSKIPLETAIKCATINAAKSIGIDNRVGSLEAGKRADIVVLDKALNVIKVFKNGL